MLDVQFKCKQYKQRDIFLRRACVWHLWNTFFFLGNFSLLLSTHTVCHYIILALTHRICHCWQQSWSPGSPINTQDLNKKKKKDTRHTSVAAVFFSQCVSVFLCRMSNIILRFSHFAKMSSHKFIWGIWYVSKTYIKTLHFNRFIL